jgi:hypothetical protein
MHLTQTTVLIIPDLHQGFLLYYLLHLNTLLQQYYCRKTSEGHEQPIEFFQQVFERHLH